MKMIAYWGKSARWSVKQWISFSGKFLLQLKMFSSRWSVAQWKEFVSGEIHGKEWASLERRSGRWSAGLWWKWYSAHLRGLAKRHWSAK